MDRRLRRGGPWCHQHRLVDEHDSWRAANLLVKRHGADTGLGAALR